MFGLCKQSLYYLLLTILVEICGLLLMGYDNWLESVKNNYLIMIGGILAYLIIIQIFCFFNKNTMAWILFSITVVINTISLLAAIGKKIPDSVKKEIEVGKNSNKKNKEIDDELDKDNEDSHSNNRSFKKEFNKSANSACKKNCINTCNNNLNKPMDLDCNNYCDNSCDKMF